MLLHVFGDVADVAIPTVAAMTAAAAAGATLNNYAKIVVYK